MYEVSIINSDKTIIHANSVDNNAARLTSAIVKQSINEIDSFNFEMLMNNPGYFKIHPRKTMVEVVNVKKNDIVFRGRVLIPTPSMSSDGVFTLTCVCEGELGYLHDSCQRYMEIENKTVKELLVDIISNHNTNVEGHKRFEVGIVEITDVIKEAVIDFKSTFDVLKEVFIDRFGGEIRVRYENGVRYLDYVKELGSKKNTTIRITKNMLSIEQERDPLSIISKLIVVGGTQDDRVYITSVNDGKDYLEDSDASTMFGLNEKTITFDDVTDPLTLKAMGLDFLKENNRVKIKNRVTHLDLSCIDVDPDEIEIYNKYPVINEPLNINDILRVVERTIDLNNPQESTVTIGDKFEDIKTYQKSSVATTKGLKDLSVTVGRTVQNTISISNELNATNDNVKNLAETVQAIIYSTNIIATTLDQVNVKLEKLSKRVNMGV